MNSFTGVYVGCGCGMQDFVVLPRPLETSAESSFGATGGASSIMANRISFALGLKGPSISTDAAGASSLLAVHQGWEALQERGYARRNEMSICGGVKLNLWFQYWAGKQAAGQLSKVGRCFTFDASADGWVHADGCAMCLIKPHADVIDGQAMLREDDGPLLGVLAGSAVNSSGSLALPWAASGPSEQELVMEALRAAGLSGCEVDAVESDGIGSIMSDAIEVQALTRSLRGQEGYGFHPLGVLAMKSGSANMQEASGIAALLKACAGNVRGRSVPNVHLRQVNTHIDPDQESNTILPSECVEFKLRSSYTGVTARGFGGTNVHVLSWGQVAPAKVAACNEPRRRRRLAFWPGGGGMLDTQDLPRRGYHIAGSWTQWAPNAMEDEGGGCYGYTVTVGARGWEQFHVLLDGDVSRRLVPESGAVWAPAGTAAVAASRVSSAPAAQTNTGGVADPSAKRGVWLIAPQEGRAQALTDNSVLDSGLAREEWANRRFRIRLHVAGKFRMVDWEPLDGL